MKTIPALFAASLIFLSIPQARAAGPGVEKIAPFEAGLNLMPVNPLSVLYLQRSQLLMRQMDLTVDIKAEEHALANELAYIADTRAEFGRMDYYKSQWSELRKKYTNEEMIITLRAVSARGGAFLLSSEHVDKAKELVASVDKKRHALEQLKAMLESTNEEIKTLTKAACSCSENPKTPGGAAASGPCSCS